MNGEKHMNTKVWESLFRLFPLVEYHDAFEKQFGLLGDLQLEYVSGSKDIERMLQLKPKK